LVLSNLGIAAAYALLGHLAHRQGELPWALAASIAVPVVATMIARWLLPRPPGLLPAEPTTEQGSADVR
jgi:hypothetical protein